MQIHGASKHAVTAIGWQPAVGAGDDHRMSGQRDTEKRPWWLFGAAGAFTLTKLQTLLPLLISGSLWGAVLTMLLSVAAYTLIAPLEIALGVILLVLIHELGHVAAARRKGLPVSAPIFIPFIGAVVNMKRNPRDTATEAYIAMGGPLAGTVGATVTLGIGWWTESALFIVLAYVGFLINLLNLIPLFPLDGGKIAASLSRWMWPAGLLIGITASFYYNEKILLVLWGWLAWELYRHYRLERGRRLVRSTWATFEVPIEDDSGGKPSGRKEADGKAAELAFTTYSELGGKQKVVLLWKAIGLHGGLFLPEQGLVHGAFAVRKEWVRRRAGSIWRVRCRVDYEIYERKAERSVSPGFRWKMGTVYVLLSAYLIGMVFISSKIGV